MRYCRKWYCRKSEESYLPLSSEENSGRALCDIIYADVKEEDKLYMVLPNSC